MATTGVKKYANLLKSLLPTGWAWRRIKEKGSDGDKLILALAPELCRVEDEGNRLFKEVMCDSTFDLLEDWERLLGIPDECTPDDYAPSLFERRTRVCQKLATKGGQSLAFYQLIAQQLGYDVDVIDVQDFKAFRAGEARAGDRLTNDSTASPSWGYTWAIVLPATTVRPFRAGQGSAGDRLRIFSNEELECIINKFKPAHTIVQFIFTE